MSRQTKHADIRVLTLTGIPYVDYYHVRPDAVEVLGIFHGARRRFSDRGATFFL